MESTKSLLEECLSIEKPSVNPPISVYDELSANSEQFPIEFPVQTIRCKTLVNNVPKSTLEENIVSTYPLIHEKALNIMCRFLLLKREHGTDKERELYKDMGIEAFIDRLLLKRSVMFCGPQDKYLLLSGETGMSGWTEVGTDNEKEPLVLKNCLSYDEMKLSAMLYVSGDTVFINDGSRRNEGMDAPLYTIERHGVIIGLIGTRLKKKYVMEYQEMIIEKKQNNDSNGYGSHQSQVPFKKLKSSSDHKNAFKTLWRHCWFELYGERSLTYADAMEKYVKQPDRRIFADNDSDIFFDNYVYSQHISIAFDCSLLEANKRAKDKGKMAYLHVVGIGLGVWRAFRHQDNLFVKQFLVRTKELSTQLSAISDVHLSYMHEISADVLTEAGTFIECASHPLGGIKVHMSPRQPSAKLTGEHEGKLVVETYAWDSNAQPGNEFWMGSLKSSGDPAAACSSQVAELHNSHVNKRFVCGKNLHVAGKHGIKHISEYAKDILAEFLKIESLLQNCLTIEKPESKMFDSILNELEESSERFPILFPIQTVRCSTLSKDISKKDVLKFNITSTYPLIHEKVLKLVCSFLTYKRIYGTEKEKTLYQDMDLSQFIDRLLQKRAVMFVGRGDHYLLLSGDRGSLGWEKIGGEEEKEPLVLQNCLSYDEMKVSALLYVTGHTFFINDGSRYNEGVVQTDTSKIEELGVIMGLIGTRFEKKNLMEYQEIIINKGQNTAKNGYGSQKSTNNDYDSKWLWKQIWAEFYGEPRLTYDEALQIYRQEASNSDQIDLKDFYTKRFVFLNEILFDNATYAKHISIAFDCALLEANVRALKQRKMAYLHVVGIGLGVWKAFMHQNSVFVKTFLERIQILSQQLYQISDVHFAYFRDVPAEILPPGGVFIKIESHPSGGIKVHLSDREPSSKLTGVSNQGKLLVETYAWDGNAHPGNEFWSGSLSGSGDPAAASSSQVSELHNAHINKVFVSSHNLHVAGTHGVHHVKEYVKHLAGPIVIEDFI